MTGTEIGRGGEKMRKEDGRKAVARNLGCAGNTGLRRTFTSFSSPVFCSSFVSSSFPHDLPPALFPCLSLSFSFFCIELLFLSNP